MRLALALLAVLATGCFTEEQSLNPDPTRFYYPTGVVVSPGGTVLYVANSDFDLNYAGGWVQALDLVAMRNDVTPIPQAFAEEPPQSAFAACERAGRGVNDQKWLHPGPCTPFELAPYLRNDAFIGAFASGALLVASPGGDRMRLFVPVRGDPSITFFDVAEGTFDLQCNRGSDGFCGAEHRLGQDREDTLRGIQLPSDPMGVAATTLGNQTAIVVAHQTQAAASLTVNHWDEPNGIPQLKYVLPELAAGPTELAPVPIPAFATALANDPTFVYRPAFVLTFRATAEVDLLRFYEDAGATDPRPFLQRDSSVALTTNAGGFDSRGVAVVDTERRACESTCGEPPDIECLVGCAEDTPLRVYMANRTPASVLVGRIRTVVRRDAAGAPTSAVEEIFFHDTIPLNFGPSRMEVGHVVGPDGQLEERVFVVCFDSRYVFMVDPEFDRIIDRSIRTGRGPHDIAIDAGVDGAGNAFSFLIIGHFTDSYLGVVDLDMRRPLTYGEMIASIGTPEAPKESR